MAFSANPAARSNFTFRQTVGGFLSAPGLPFVDTLSEKLIARVFAKHGGLFGRTYTTAIVLWAFMSQVLRDGKEASCQIKQRCQESLLRWLRFGRLLACPDPNEPTKRMASTTQ